jgi:hypothetical protein
MDAMMEPVSRCRDPYAESAKHCEKNNDHMFHVKPDKQRKEPLGTYQRVFKGVLIDTYDINTLYSMTNSAAIHALKKVLVPGQRGTKSVVQDYREAIASLHRAIQIEEEHG